MKGVAGILFVISISAFAQEVDLVRLGYNDAIASQVGMSASPDGKFIAFVYSDKTIKIFDVGVNKFAKRFSGPYSELSDVYLTNTGSIVLTSEKEIQLWDWKKEALVEKFSVTEEITRAAYSGKGNFLAVGLRGGTTNVYDLTTRKLIREIPLGKNHVGTLAFHPNGKEILISVIAGLNLSPQPLHLFDIATGAEKATSTEEGYFMMATFNESGTDVIAAGLNKTATKTFMLTLSGPDLKVKKKFGGDLNITNSRIAYGGLFQGDHLFALTLSAAFNLYDAQSGTLLFTTKSDKTKIPTFAKMGVGSFNVYSLLNLRDKVIVNASKNNINQIFDAKSNSIIGYFYSDSNDDFAIVSRDGRIDGTPGAFEKLFWTARNNTTKTTLGSTFEKGFTPRLLSQILDEKASVQQEFVVDDVAQKIPVLKLKAINGLPPETGGAHAAQTLKKNTQIEIEVAQNLGEVKEVKLYQNAKFLKVLPNQGAKFLFDVSLNSSFGKENYFYAVATSKLGVDSEKLKFTIAYSGATNETPNLYLITIGINKYKNPKYNLNYAQTDADGVEALVKQSAGSLFNQVISHPIRNDKAIKANILKAFDDVKKNALEQDVLLVYYAGHGVMSEGGAKPKDFFIVPSDVTQLYGKDDMLHEKAISAEEIKSIAQGINAQKQIFILDACQSAGALESVAARGAMEEKAIAQMARSTGTFWITATGSDQFASEFEKLGHGVFTYSLLEGMKGEADTNKDKKLTVRELSTYIENKVPQLSEQFKGTSQYPSAYSFGNDFPIAVLK